MTCGALYEVIIFFSIINCNNHIKHLWTIRGSNPGPFHMKSNTQSTTFMVVVVSA